MTSLWGFSTDGEVAETFIAKANAKNENVKFLIFVKLEKTCQEPSLTSWGIPDFESSCLLANG